MIEADNSIVVEIDPRTYEEEPDPPQGTMINGKLYKPHMFKPGVSPNPGGRPKGQSLKEFTREMLAAMTPEERIEFLAGIPKQDIWRMAEGNPTEDRNVSITVPTPILGGATQELGTTLAHEALDSGTNS